MDTGPGGLVHYSCIRECDGFEVRTLDGAVILTKELDAETETQHLLTVLATDSGIPQLSSTATVVINGMLYVYNKHLHSWRLDIWSFQIR